MKRILTMLALPVALAFAFIAWGAQPTSASLSPVNISNTASDSRFPAVAVTAGGDEHVVWEESVDISPTLRVSYIWHSWWNGVTWSPAITVGTGSRAALAIGPDDTPHVVWTDDFGGAATVFYSDWNGASWAIPKQVAPGVSGNATSPAIVVDGANTVRVAWGQFDNTGLGNYRLYYATSASGGAGAWTAVPLSGATGAYAPSLAVDGAGTLHLAWQAGGFGTGEIYYATLVNTNTVSFAENISQSPLADSQWPSLVIAASGLPVVAWGELVGSRYDVQTSVRSGGIWSTPVNVSKSAGSDSTVPRLGRVNSALIAMWNEATVSPQIDWALGTGSAWGPPQPLVSGGGSWQGLALTGSNRGSAFYAFDGGSGPNGDVYADAVSIAQVFLPAVRR